MSGGFVLHQRAGGDVVRGTEPTEKTQKEEFTQEKPQRAPRNKVELYYTLALASNIITINTEEAS